MRDAFRRFASRCADAAGSPGSFLVAVLAIAAWASLGPRFNYSENWQLIVNTGTTIVTFLMVFLIQTAQNRDTRALHLKIDELIRAAKHARNKLIDLEHMTDAELEELQNEFKRLKERVPQS